MMIDHTGITVRDFSKSRSFYQTILGALGYQQTMEFPGHAGFGKDHQPAFWISTEGEPLKKFHIAFAAPSRKSVDEFHQAALRAGGKDNGAPGLRPNYHENYYAAFILDPDGYNIEAVCHQKE